MKRKILMFTICSLPIIGYGQKKIGFTYNLQGHMTSRQEITLRNAVQPLGLQEEPAIGTLNERTIRIYPNPTKGNLKVEITGPTEDLKGEIAIFDMKGKMVTKSKVASSEIIFDLSSNSSGSYVMKIILNGESTSWKIIKE